MWATNGDGVWVGDPSQHMSLRATSGLFNALNSIFVCEIRSSQVTNDPVHRRATCRTVKPVGDTSPDPERQLVDRCVAKDVSAWESLYLQCHSPLLRSIRAMLGPICDSNLVEEIEARVWYSLAANSARLLDRFEAQRASLNTYLANLARNEVGGYLRSERRRRKRERMVAKTTPHDCTDEPDEFASIDEFRATLSPKEKEFCDDFLLSPSARKADSGFSDANRWQLRHRVYRKLLAFLEKQRHESEVKQDLTR